MKILKMLGLVVALHLVVLMLVYLPACQSSSAYRSRSSANGSGTAVTTTDTPNGLSRVEAARALTPLVQYGQPSTAAAAQPAPAYTSAAPAASGAIYTYPASTESFAAPVVSLPATAPEPQNTASALQPFSPSALSSPALPAEKPAGSIQATHTVVPNDSPWKIARQYGITQAALLAANNLPSNTTLQPGQKLIIPAKAPAPAANAIPGTIIYKVKANDSLASIAARNNTTVERIMTLNKLTSPVIRIDQELFLPAADFGAASNGAPNAATTTPAATTVASGATITYTVKPGDSLDRIATYFGASRNEIATINHISNPKYLRDGAKLTIPNARKNLTSAVITSSTAATTTAPAAAAATPPPAAQSPISPASPIAPAPLAPADNSPIAPASPSPIAPATGAYTPPVNTINDTAPLPFGTPQN